MHKQLINTGLTGDHFSVVLSDGFNDVILDVPDYSYFRIHEGMTDQEIMNFA